MRNGVVRKRTRGGPLGAGLSMKMQDRPPECTRTSWLQQQQAFDGFTYHHQPASARYMPELTVAFDKGGFVETGTFSSHSNLPSYVGGDDSHVAVKEPSPNEAVVSDSESDEDWFFIDDLESYSGRGTPAPVKEKLRFNRILVTVTVSANPGDPE